MSQNRALINRYGLLGAYDETVATVDYFGVVHALSQGETTITIKDSNKEDCAVSVKVTVR